MAVLQADLIDLTHSWVMRIWLLLMGFLVVVTVANALSEGAPAEALSGLIGSFPLIWSIPIIIVSSGAVSSEAGVVADSILSKAITRYEYILAKMASRLIANIGLYLVIVAPAAYIILQNVEGLDGNGIIWAILTIGMFIALVTNLAVAFSTLFNRTLVAMIVTWVLWYAAGGIFSLLQSDYLSPIRIIENLPDVLQGTYQTSDQLRILAGFGIPALVVVLAASLYFARKDL